MNFSKEARNSDFDSVSQTHEEDETNVEETTGLMRSIGKHNKYAKLEKHSLFGLQT
jgi:hypothetical protein